MDMDLFIKTYTFKTEWQDVSVLPHIPLEYSTSEMSKRYKFHHAIATIHKSHIPVLWGNIQAINFSLPSTRILVLKILNPPFSDTPGHLPRKNLRGIHVRDFLGEMRDGHVIEQQPKRQDGSVFIGKGGDLIWRTLSSSLSKCIAPECDAGSKLRRQSIGAPEETKKRQDPRHGLYLAFNRSKETFQVPTDFVEDQALGVRAVVSVDNSITEDWAMLLLLPHTDADAPCESTPHIFCPKTMELLVDADRNPALAPFFARGVEQMMLPCNSFLHLLDYVLDPSRDISRAVTEVARLIANPAPSAGAAAGGTPSRHATTRTPPAGRTTVRPSCRRRRRRRRRRRALCHSSASPLRREAFPTAAPVRRGLGATALAAPRAPSCVSSFARAWLHARLIAATARLTESASPLTSDIPSDTAARLPTSPNATSGRACRLAAAGEAAGGAATARPPCP